jgi:two-component system chemotaxis response regulator CheB
LSTEEKKLQKSPPDRVVVIGASAGGVTALRQLVSLFPRGSNAAYFVVMHIPPHTPSELHLILQQATELTVTAAADEEPIVADHVYVASADRHLMMTDTRVRLTRGPRECRSRPAVDALFRSAAAAFGKRAVGVVLTGFLDDGTAGLWAIKDSGGTALVQHPDNAEHSSMPRSAMQHVDVDMVGTLAQLGDRISTIVMQPCDMSEPAAPGWALRTEVTIAEEGNGLRAGVMELGKVSKFTCPDCNGVLVQIEQGRVLRFRCHTGHAFSLKTLLAEVNESIDTGLWSALRAVEERILLLTQIARLEEDGGERLGSVEAMAQADGAKKQAETLRRLLMNSNTIGHLPSTRVV